MALCEFKRGQAHRDDLTTPRFDVDSREPEKRKATQSAAFKRCFPLLTGTPYSWRKKARQKAGRK
ncbi:hypothetical protein FD823_03160 [Klebsiella pneumoniae]|nr:hypothetical protein [Klebsiella pneumoniae]HBX6078841.1 hypothetical protein [Klebsiella pneumoniae]